MADGHFVYKDLEGASTGWGDLHRKIGVLPPKPKVFKPAAFSPAEDPDLRPKSVAWIDEKSTEDLEELEDDDLDDDRFFQEYRKKRLQELQEEARVVKPMSILRISSSEFVREVSQASQNTWIVVILYKEGIQECGLLMKCLEELATRYPLTKFVKMISTDCIPSYLDIDLPTILVYNDGVVKETFVGLSRFGGKRCTPESVALMLCLSDPVLNDGRSKNASKDRVIDGVRKKFIEKLVAQHENEMDEYSSD